MRLEAAITSAMAFLLLFVIHQLSNAADTLIPGEVLKDWQLLKSSNKFFQLGFFNPVHSSNRYLAIRCMDSNENKMVWVANRENPLNDTSGYLNFTQDGYLVIYDERGTSFTINSGSPAMSNASVTLLDSGNLVIKSGLIVMWQSFDHPTDTLLPGMKIGLVNLKSQSQPQKQFLTSWLGPGAPSAGAFTLGVDQNDTRHFEVWKRGIPYWRYGDWNETEDGYFPLADENMKMRYISDERERYFSYSVAKYNISWIRVDYTGKIHILLGDGNFTILNLAVACDEEEFKDEMCIEKKPSNNCSKGDKFFFVLGAMDSWEVSDNKSLGLSDCEMKCRSNCFCTAYASLWLDGLGCKFSNGSMHTDVPAEIKESFFIRNATAKNQTQTATKDGTATPIPPTPPEKAATKNPLGVKVFGPLAASALLVMVFLVWYFMRRRKLSEGDIGSRRTQVGWETEQFMNELGSSIAAIDDRATHRSMINCSKDRELPLFSFSTIEAATGHFSGANKLGQGGFGPVFKGILDDGKEIAVKRLSERSGQGAEEFKNEVMLISKVQHKNLVRLYGCCIKGEEKLLIYEYLQNKSLDTFLFDETKRVLLDWKLRMSIVEGIAQGLLYLHKYSRLKIIHRDLKISNILLDNSMNPKISDFGTAKIFQENESRANTSRIVGTYGYMSPEYAMDGLYSVKSDVFSFGVMVLEIICGKKNKGFYQTNHSLNLVRHAWNHWKEENVLELMDPILAETCPIDELRRFVRIGLLCVQQNAADRPTMSEVVSMLGGDGRNYQEPKESSFTSLSTHNSSDLPNDTGSSSVNEVTISSTYAR